MTTPTQPTQILDNIRTRLTSLTASLATLTHALQSGNPLLPYPHLQETFASIVREIHQLTTFMKTHQAFLDSTVVYPLPNFPWVKEEQEALVGQLGKKTRTRGWEGWVGKAVRAEEHARGHGSGVDGGGALNVEQRRELWDSAAELARPVLEEIPKGMDYTMEELVNGVENVETGLRRRLNMGEKVTDEGPEERLDFGTSMPVEDVLRFMTRGERPRGVGMFLE